MLRHFPLPFVRSTPTVCRILLLCLAGLLPVVARAEPVEFDLPAQPVADALLAFSKQSKREVLFSFDGLHQVQSTAVLGRFEPEDALVHLLRNTGFTTRRNSNGKFIIVPARSTAGAIEGRLLAPDGQAASGVQVVILDTRQQA